MKKYIILASYFLGALLLFSSCDKVETEPQMNLDNIKAPELVSPAADSLYVLTKATADSIFDHFSWLEASYPLNDIPSTLYALEMAMAGTDFASRVELGSGSELSLDILQGPVNQAIVSFIGGEFSQDTVVNVEFRVKAYINANNVSQAVNAYSVALSAQVNPYPSTVAAPPLYLIGDGTTIGWDNSNTDLQFTYDPNDEVYKIVATLGGAGLFIKAFEVPGQWWPQWGTNDSGTSETGTLVYRPTDPDPDPVAIPTPEEAGDYLIIFDLVNKVYTIEVSDIASTMHIVGDATEAGWDAGNAVPMEKTAPGHFQLVTTLSSDASEGFKFLVNQGAWAPMYGSVEGAELESGVLVYRETESDPDPVSIPPPSVSGTFLIEMNIMDLTYSVTPQ